MKKHQLAKYLIVDLVTSTLTGTLCGLFVMTFRNLPTLVVCAIVGAGTFAVLLLVQGARERHTAQLKRSH